jgi:hypothetical protein
MLPTHKRVAVKDDVWNPTVPKGGYSGNPDEPWLGRRIEVAWLTQEVPPLDMRLKWSGTFRKGVNRSARKLN